VEAPVLTDGTVTLDALRADDAEPLLAADDEQAQWAFGKARPITREEARNLIDRAIQRWRRGSPWRSFAIRRAGDPTYAGCLLLKSRLPIYELEIRVAPAARSDHVGRGAVRLACDYAFTTLGAAAVEGRLRFGNLASEKMLRAVGFEPKPIHNPAVDREGRGGPLP
jgi:RimJ/RimL family protein N-acetyltransferase